MKILVVEDEKKIASFIRMGLEGAGFSVEISHHGDEGYTLATTMISTPAPTWWTFISSDCAVKSKLPTRRP